MKKAKAKAEAKEKGSYTKQSFADTTT